MEKKDDSRLQDRVYVMACENDCFYVGATFIPSKRFRQHVTKLPPKIAWLKENPKIRNGH